MIAVKCQLVIKNLQNHGQPLASKIKILLGILPVLIWSIFIYGLKSLSRVQCRKILIRNQLA